MRRQFRIVTLALLSMICVSALKWPQILWSLLFVGPLILLGLYDYFQKRRAIRRNFPLLGRFRTLFESIRPEIQQYFIESNLEGVPFSREQRSLVYQRSKNQLDSLPFGTQMNVYEPGYEWVNHSLAPVHALWEQLRITVGGPECTKPYSSSILNISSMSFGSLSPNAIRALNYGAKAGGFAHCTGEGGVSPYHLEGGGDLVWQLGTGYFSCRTPEGQFDPKAFSERATHPQIKMIEIKLSQGAKPGHGGILPARKVTAEIAAIRGVPLGKDVISPPAHSAFQSPIELIQFIARLRQLSGGKPVGIKLCIGKRREFLAIIKAMLQLGSTPDYIYVDGAEGGTGAAPLEFSNHVGTPGIDALIFVHNALVGAGLRDRIRIFASGKVTTGFNIIKLISIGADACMAARAFMLSLGCIQALRCNSNTCPTGVATQDPDLREGLVVEEKRVRVARFHKETVESVAEMLGAMGLSHTRELKPWHIMRRTDASACHHYGEIFEYLEPGSLLRPHLPKSYARAWEAASPETFRFNEQESLVVGI